MAVTEYWLQSIGPEYIMEAVEAGWHTRDSQGVTVEELMDYAKIGISYARRALKMAEQLGMMVQSGNRYQTVDALSVIERSTKDDWPTLFGSFLPRFKPFMTFVSLLSRGRPLEESSRKVRVIYYLSASNDDIRRTFSGWGLYAGVFEKLDGSSMRIRIETGKLETEEIRELLEAMQNDMQAHIYLNRKLGEDLYAHVSRDNLGFLVASIRNHERDPRKAIEDGMRALEDYLRDTLVEKGGDGSKCTGITALLAELSKGDLILTKQAAIGSGLGAIRNAATHGNDKDTGKPWFLNADAALESVLLSMTLTRSIHRHVHDDIQCI